MSAKRTNGTLFSDPHSLTIDIWIICRLAKIKAWIDEHNPGDSLIPLSVALEERLVHLSADEGEEELKKLGTQSALGKITQAGYTSLDVSLVAPDVRYPE